MIRADCNGRHSEVGEVEEGEEHEEGVPCHFDGSPLELNQGEGDEDAEQGLEDHVGHLHGAKGQGVGHAAVQPRCPLAVEDGSLDLDHWLDGGHAVPSDEERRGVDGTHDVHHLREREREGGRRG